MEVGQVRDSEAVKARRQPVDLDLEHAGAEPAGLEEAVGQEDEREEREKTDPDHSFNPETG
jgi:hypothetical protein